MVPPPSTPSFSDGSSGVPLPDDESIRQLRIVHGPVLLSFVTRLIGGDARAAEIVVGATLDHARGHPGARDAGGRWRRGWLFAEAKRRCVEMTPAPAEGSDTSSGAGRVAAAVRSLPESQRLVLVMIYFQEKPVSDVAALLELPEDVVVARVLDGLLGLREALKHDSP